MNLFLIFLISLSCTEERTFNVNTIVIPEGAGTIEPNSGLYIGGSELLKLVVMIITALSAGLEM